MPHTDTQSRKQCWCMDSPQRVDMIPDSTPRGFHGNIHVITVPSDCHQDTCIHTQCMWCHPNDDRNSLVSGNYFTIFKTKRKKKNKITTKIEWGLTLLVLNLSGRKHQYDIMNLIFTCCLHSSRFFICYVVSSEFVFRGSCDPLCMCPR